MIMFFLLKCYIFQVFNCFKIYVNLSRYLIASFHYSPLLFSWAIILRWKWKITVVFTFHGSISTNSYHEYNHRSFVSTSRNKKFLLYIISRKMLFCLILERCTISLDDEIKTVCDLENLSWWKKLCISNVSTFDN